MKKTILWLLLITATLMYVITIYGWILEGNYNQRQKEIEQDLQDMRLYNSLDKR
jgi:F0F1-type ATP synthase membrane subunit b/b'